MTTHEITYRYSRAGQSGTTFALRFDSETSVLADLPSTGPEWTALEVHQCANCPLTPEQNPHCPMALALMEPVARFGEVRSYSQVAVEVVTEERTVSFEGGAQDGISPLIGLLCAASGCPVTAPFRPMARFHLPFASELETVYRAASMYLLGQYFRAGKGSTTDLELNGLLDIYRNIEVVNRAMAKRLREAAREDSTVNAIVVLDLFAKTMPLAVEESLEDLRGLFDAYL
jgi:hypothetical protein